MSAASTPTPFPKGSESRSSSSKYTVFWPMLIFFFGIGGLSLYEVIAMQDRLDELSQTIDKLDGNVKRAQYERAKFFSISKDLLALAPKNANAEEIVTRFKLKELQAAQPKLFAQDYSGMTGTGTNSTATPSAPATNSSLLPSAPSSDEPAASLSPEPAK